MISSQLFVKLANHIPFHSHSTPRKALTMSSLRPGAPTYISMGEFGHWFGLRGEYFDSTGRGDVEGRLDNGLLRMGNRRVGRDLLLKTL